MEKRKRPPVPNWCHWLHPKLKSTHINTLQQQQARTGSRQRREGQGRAGQGNIQRLVVVVVAASETLRLSWVALLTVDSLSSVDLTSQGFFYIPACAFMCRCMFVCISRSADVTRRKQICPLSLRLFSWPFSHLTEVLLSTVSPSPASATVCLCLTDFPPTTSDLFLSHLKPHTDSYTPSLSVTKQRFPCSLVS